MARSEATLLLRSTASLFGQRTSFRCLVHLWCRRACADVPYCLGERWLEEKVERGDGEHRHGMSILGAGMSSILAMCAAGEQREQREQRVSDVSDVSVISSSLCARLARKRRECYIEAWLGSWMSEWALRAVRTALARLRIS